MTSITSLHNTILDAHTALSINQLLEKHPDIAKRTAQRWLNQLLADGKVAIDGAGRSRRYKTTSGTGIDSTVNPDNFPTYITLSADSKEVLAYIEQPIQKRDPIGYQQAFLDAYQPNETWYLSEPIRKQLHRMGDANHSTLPVGTYGRAILDRLLIDLSWASSHLEGNTYSHLDTRQLIEQGKSAHGKSALETQMILNHKAAIELLVDNVDNIGFNRYTMLNLHAALSENLLPNPADEGRIRQHIVEISKSVFHPLAGEVQIGLMLNEMLSKADLINDPFEQSFFMMVHLPYLQPFADVNKRTSRLAANLPLIRANLCPLTFLGVPEKTYTRATLGVYEMNRVELLRDLYLWAYERSTQEYLAVRQNLSEPDPFRLQYRDVIKKTIKEVVIGLEEDPLLVIKRALTQQEITDVNVEALVIEELRRLHEGVLIRYGLKPSTYMAWKNTEWGKNGS
jgi:hypothetical protein